MKRALLLLPAAALLAAGAIVVRPEAATFARRTFRPPESGPEEIVSPKVARILPAPSDRPEWTSIAGRLRRSVADLSGDEIELLQRKLARLLEENPGAAMEILALLEQETDPDTLQVLARVLSSDGAAMSDPAVIGALVRMADQGTLLERRAAAVEALMRLPALDPRATDAVLRIAQADGPPELRVAAVATAAAWLQNHPDGAAPLVRAIAGLAARAEDPELRGHAIQAVALASRGAETDVVQTMAGLLRDPEPRNRALAALALGGAAPEARGAAALRLEEAVGTEPSADLQRGMLIHLVRAAGLGAEASLARIGDAAPRLAADVRDYLDILKSERDPGRVWELKTERDLSRGIVSGAGDHTD